MKLRGSIYVGTLATTVLMPLAALAETGTVATSPLGTSAPAVGLPMLGLLAVVLGIGSVYVLRRRSMRTTATLVVLAATIALAGITYATNAGVLVSGAQCTRRTTQTWDSVNAEMLENQCSNDLLIRALDAGCVGPPEVNQPACVVGETVPAGTTCNLPFCV